MILQVGSSHSQEIMKALLLSFGFLWLFWAEQKNNAVKETMAHFTFATLVKKDAHTCQSRIALLLSQWEIFFPSFYNLPNHLNHLPKS